MDTENLHVCTHIEDLENCRLPCVLTSTKSCSKLVAVVCYCLQHGNGDELVSLLMTCDIIIYHITETAQQVDEASSLLQGKPHSI